VFPDPVEKKLHGVPVGALCVRIAQRALEEFLCRKYGIGARAVDNVGQLIADG
jgi:hypothetical protein